MAAERDHRQHIARLREAIAEDAAELRIRWEESRGKAVRDWRGLTAVAREILNMAGSMLPHNGSRRDRVAAGRFTAFAGAGYDHAPRDEGSHNPCPGTSALEGSNTRERR